MTIWSPSTAELDDLDLLLHGAYRPLTGFLTADDIAAVRRDGRLPDGTPWPVPVTLTVPYEVVADTLVLEDEQRTPVAELTVTATYPAGDGRIGLAGPVRRLGVRERPDGLRLPDLQAEPSTPVARPDTTRPADPTPPDPTSLADPTPSADPTPLTDPTPPADPTQPDPTQPDPTQPGPARLGPARPDPAETHGIGPAPTHPAPGRPVLGVPMVGPPHLPELVALAAAAEELGARIRLIPLVGHGTPVHVDGPALVRACTGAADELAALGAPAEVLPVALPRHPTVDPGRDRELAGRVAVALGATHLTDDWGGDVTPPRVVLDVRSGDWAPADRVPVENHGDLAAHTVAAHVIELVARDAPVPSGLTPESTEHELRRAVRPPGRGVTVLFTGLSGSGKSTIANAVHAALTGRTDRTVTLLDGDVVRTMLSSELGFSREHRELNVRRIGYVAAEVTRHGGVALCAPIAPYASVRAEVRAMVERHGRFLLVHVSTPLEVCEARDRKGLYAKARRGEIAEFTGISDPYEVPTDAEITIDASRTPVADATERILNVIDT